MTRPPICAVIPAAGRGSRLGIDVPKVFAPLGKGLTVWDVLYARIAPHVAHVHLILPPAVSPPPSVAFSEKVSWSIQPVPLGMGDAIFGAHPAWKDFPHILAVWGDQMGVSEQTLAEAARRQVAATEPQITLPLVEAADLYVEYVLDDDRRRLLRVLSTREGDKCNARGLSDVGVFGLSTRGLLEAWTAYLARPGPARGNFTKEINFLPFLPVLSMDFGWHVCTIAVAGAEERRGINTPDDLAFFRDKA